MNRGSQTIKTCHLYIVQKEFVSLSTNSGQRSLNHSKHIIEKMPTPKLRHEAEVELRAFSKILFLSIRKYFRLVVIHPCVVLYAIFRPEPMHVFFLGIAKLIKNCPMDMLGNTESVLNTIENGKNVAKS